MRRVKYYDNYDLSLSENFNMFLNMIDNIKEENLNINDILEYYNILKFFNDDILNRVDSNIKNKCISSKPLLNKILNKYCSTINDKNIINIIDIVEWYYIDNFFEIINTYKVYEKITNTVIFELLNMKSNYLFSILHIKELVHYYNGCIRDCLIKNEECAEWILDEYEVKNIGNHKKIYFPNSFTIEDREKVIINYINSDNANINYLRLISQIRNISELKISDKVRLVATKKSDELEKRLFKKENMWEMSSEVIFSDKVENTIEDISTNTWKYIYSSKWIKNNKRNFSTLLNNFIYLFNYVDNQMRWSMISKRYFSGIFENALYMKSKYDYPTSVIFFRYDVLSDLQMIGYYNELLRNNIRLEDIITWFFNKYLYREFKIKDYRINMPSKESSYLEKCRTLLPEIDRVLKEYNDYVDYGNIDSELVSISSNQIFFEDIKSLLNCKYVYPIGNEYDRVIYCFFSNQCSLGYIENRGKIYDTFFELLNNENIKEEEIVKYEIDNLNYLIDKKYLSIDKDGYIRMNNKIQLLLLRDIYNNYYISYWKLSKIEREEIDKLVRNGILKFDSSLFSIQEKDYLNYIFNKRSFNNSLDLRNKYLHGINDYDENYNYKCYMKILKILILIIININEELCIRDKYNN